MGTAVVQEQLVMVVLVPQVERRGAAGVGGTGGAAYSGGLTAQLVGAVLITTSYSTRNVLATGGTSGNGATGVAGALVGSSAIGGAGGTGGSAGIGGGKLRRRAIRN